MGSRVELFEQIRRDRDREGLSIRALAERHGVHRRAVRQALVSPVPPAKRSPQRRPAPKLGAYRALIDAWLEDGRAAQAAPHGEADLAAPRRRARRRRRRDDGPWLCPRSKRAMGWPVGELFIPQVHAPGALAEVDWGQAQIELAGVATRMHLFLMRASFSGAAFCQASLVETQQAFLELHVEAFEWFGGVFEQIRFDNLGSAVKQVRVGGASRPTGSSRCARTICSSRSSPRRGSRARTRRAVSRAKSGAFAATTSSPSRRSRTSRSSTR
jgi:transposase